MILSRDGSQALLLFGVYHKISHQLLTGPWPSPVHTLLVFLFIPRPLHFLATCHWNNCRASGKVPLPLRGCAEGQHHRGRHTGVYLVESVRGWKSTCRTFHGTISLCPTPMLSLSSFCHALRSQPQYEHVGRLNDFAFCFFTHVCMAEFTLV